ncbi:hypothetical protein [Enterococcus sp. AZ109]|uniref:hypothetical protein n=1 Tax=Enterococcus sp. AZ109 TaxID=2774634 RepID=UPI003F219F42
MKRIFLLSLLIILSIGVQGCSKNNGNQSETDNSTTKEEKTIESTSNEVKSKSDDEELELYTERYKEYAGKEEYDKALVAAEFASRKAPDDERITKDYQGIELIVKIQELKLQESYQEALDAITNSGILDNDQENIVAQKLSDYSVELTNELNGFYEPESQANVTQSPTESQPAAPGSPNANKTPVSSEEYQNFMMDAESYLNGVKSYYDQGNYQASINAGNSFMDMRTRANEILTAYDFAQLYNDSNFVMIENYRNTAYQMLQGSPQGISP